ncbi:hypothetical protein FB45DRAFT_1056570 [Roridomyces roridus]|uniref:BTB domain-containing protein n=1 Tax=Roridomyces roridus TaxID=1738132 RepID=A0AAD7BZ11_9AGAR|nr:hypothetical protein FB45DRAFT_1056570 [Roridomyces roridus]
MSDTRTPSAKRKRSETVIDEGPTTRSHIWMPHGDIILQAESTQFRVHRDILAKESDALRDMFSSLPSTTDKMVVKMPGDSAKDWELFLGVLYEPFKDQEMRPFDEIAAMLRLGSKHGISAAEANAVQRIQYEYPDKLDAWIEATGRDFTKIEHHNGVELDVLALAHEFGFSSFPIIAYNCLDIYSLDSIFLGMIERPDGSRVTLPPHLESFLVAGFAQIMRFQHKSYSWLTDDKVIPCHSCKGPDNCAGARDKLHAFLAWNQSADAPGCFALDVWTEEWSLDFCDGCAKAGKKAFDSTRTKAWEALPGFFGIRRLDDTE